MTKEEIDILWQKAMQESIKDGEIFTRYHFAEMVAQKALAEHAMQEVQRLGQEIEQEPVAWRNAAIRVGENLSSVGPDGYYDMTEQQWLDWALSVVTVHAPPPQRTWVGLTEQEHTDIAVECGCMSADWVFYGAAVERKLKEKNT